MTECGSICVCLSFMDSTLSLQRYHIKERSFFFFFGLAYIDRIQLKLKKHHLRKRNIKVVQMFLLFESKNYKD